MYKNFFKILFIFSLFTLLYGCGNGRIICNHVGYSYLRNINFDGWDKKGETFLFRYKTGKAHFFDNKVDSLNFSLTSLNNEFVYTFNTKKNEVKKLDFIKLEQKNDQIFWKDENNILYSYGIKSYGYEPKNFVIKEYNLKTKSEKVILKEKIGYPHFSQDRKFVITYQNKNFTLIDLETKDKKVLNLDVLGLDRARVEADKLKVDIKWIISNNTVNKKVLVHYSDNLYHSTNEGHKSKSNNYILVDLDTETGEFINYKVFESNESNESNNYKNSCSYCSESILKIESNFVYYYNNRDKYFYKFDIENNKNIKLSEKLDLEKSTGGIMYREPNPILKIKSFSKDFKKLYAFEYFYNLEESKAKITIKKFDNFKEVSTIDYRFSLPNGDKLNLQSCVY